MEIHKYLLLLKITVLLKGLCECFNIDVKRPRIFSGPEDALFGFSVLQHENNGEKSILVGAPWDGPQNNRKGDIYKCIVGDEINSNCSKVNLGENAFQNISRNLKNSHLGMTLTPAASDGFLRVKQRASEYSFWDGVTHSSPWRMPTKTSAHSTDVMNPTLQIQACAPLWSQECGTSLFSTGICASVTNDMEPKEVIAPTAQRCTTYMDIVIVLDGSNSIYPWYEVQNFLSNILSKFHISPEQMQVGVLQYGEISVHEWSLRDYQTTQDVVEAAKNISRQEGRETRTAYAIQMACSEAFSPDRGAREGATKVMIVVTDGESHDGEDLPESLAECEKRNITRYAIAVLGHYSRRQQDPETFINEIKYIASDPDEKYFFNVTDEAALNDIVDALGDRIFSLEARQEGCKGGDDIDLKDGILFGMVGAYDWEGGVLKESKEGQLKPSREAFEKEFPLELKNHAAYLGYTVSSVVVGDWKRLYVAGAPRFKHKGKVILFDLTPEGDVLITQALNGEQIGSYFGSEVCVVDVDQDGITDILLIAAPMFLGAGNKETGKVYVYCLDGDGFAPNGTLHSQKKAQDARFGYAMAVAPDLNHDGYADLLVGAPLEDDHQGALYIYHGDEYYIIPQYKQRIPGSSLSPGLQYFGRSLSALLDLDGDELVDLAVGAQGTAVLLKSRSIVQINVSLSFQPHSINVIQKNCYRAGRDSACLNATVCFLALSRSPGSYGTYFDMQMGAMLDDRKILARALFDYSSQRQTLMGVIVRVGETICYTLPFHVFDTADYIRPISFTLRFKINDTESGPVLDEGWPTTFKKSEDAQFKIECTALGSNSHSCNVSYPVFRSQSKVNFMLEFEFSCTSLISKVQMKLIASSDSVENEGTLSDNSVQLQSIVHDSNLNRYEVHPTRTISEGTGPEFYTHFKVQNLGCYAVSNVDLSVSLPAVASGDRVFATVVDASFLNSSGVNCSIVSDLSKLKSSQRDVRPLHPEDMKKTELLNCTSSWCVEVVCHIQQLLKGETALVRITRRIQDNFFRQTVLEVLKGRSIPISLWILIGSIIGGLLLLALLVFFLWKLGFFTRKQRKDEDENDDN
ncbi:Integrin alpha-10 [Labeo rohita]|uniref:Integrin alpha-10 n=1 Tax=Labeo rohita TaxID=84645 RepID=A0ABQ8LYQ8_LABRO|nr:Integrin alpha-10 [Labeo rohita]